MPAITSALSPICGTHLGETKLVTSISFSPAACSRCTSSILTLAGTGSFSFCSPSRGPTSTSLTLSGYFISIAFLPVDHAGDGLALLQRLDLARDLGDARRGIHGTESG